MPTAMYSIYATVGLHVRVPRMPVLQLYESLIPHFLVLMTGQFISCIILMTQGHLQGQKIKSQGQLSHITIFNMCNTYVSCNFDWAFLI